MDSVTVPAIRRLGLLPSNPVVTLSLAIKLLDLSKPTAIKAIDTLVAMAILQNTSGKRRDCAYAYHRVLGCAHKLVTKANVRCSEPDFPHPCDGSHAKESRAFENLELTGKARRSRTDRKRRTRISLGRLESRAVTAP